MTTSEITKGLANLFVLGSDEIKAKYPTLRLQLLKFKSVTEGEKPKLRFTLSDGQHIVQGVQSDDSSTIKTMMGNAPPAPMSIIEIKHFEPFLMSGTRPVLLIWQWNIVSDGPVATIGNAEPLSDIRKFKADFESNKKPDTAAAAPAPAAVSKTTTAAAASKTKQAPAAKVHTVPAHLKKKLGKSLIKIERVSPYTNAWVMRVRVSSKSELRTYRNQRGEGKLFNVTFFDESGEIRATAFNQSAEQFYDVLQEGGVYYISKLGVNIAKKQFSNVNNEYELMFERDSVVEPAPASEAEDVPQIQYNFTELARLADIDNNATADIVAVVHSVGEAVERTSKAGRNFELRELQIVDKSNVEVKCTLWGKQAKDFSGHQGEVIVVKNAKVSDFGGRSLSVMGGATLQLSPDIPEAHELKGWFDSDGSNQTFERMKTDAPAAREQGPTITIDFAKTSNYGASDTADYFNITATILFIRKTTLFYPSCNSGKECMKKAIEQTDGQWRCEKCDASFERPKYRFMMTANVGDATGDIWLSFFNDTAGVVMDGVTADEVQRYVADEDEDGLGKILANAVGREWTLRVQARLDTYSDQSGVRYSCQNVAKVDLNKSLGQLLDEIEKY